MDRKARIYVAGPYSKGDPCVNTHIAIQAGQSLLDYGFVPFVPHVSHFWHTMIPNPYEVWMEWDAEWIKVCDGLVRLPGESAGADREVVLANSLGIPVFLSIQEVLGYDWASHPCEETGP